MARGFLTERLPPGIDRPQDLDRVWGPVYHAVVQAQPDRFQPPGRFAAAPMQAAVALFPTDGHCFGGDSAGPEMHVAVVVGHPSPRTCRLQVRAGLLGRPVR